MGYGLQQGLLKTFFYHLNPQTTSDACLQELLARHMRLGKPEGRSC